MKILFIVTHLGQTGVNNVVLDLVKGMQSHGHECAIFYFKEVENIKFPCLTQRLTSLFDKRDFSNYNVVHSHGLIPDTYIMLNKPINTHTLFVSTLHCYVFQDFQDLYGRFIGPLFGLFFLIVKLRHDKLVALSKDAMKYYHKYYGNKRLTYAYNTRDLDMTRDLSDEEQSEFLSFKGKDIVIGMNCVLLKRKGIDIMLKALALLPTNYKLFIVGEGPHKTDFVEQIDALGLKGRTYFAGKHKEAYRYLNYYDIYALPSRSEGFPLALLEAAAYGCRVACSDLPVIKEAFTTEEVSMFHVPEEQGLAEAVTRVMNDDNIKKNIKQKFEDCYSPKTFYARYISIYTGNL